MGWVFDRQIGLIRGGTRPTAPVHDGNRGVNALGAAVDGDREESSGESRLTVGVASGLIKIRSDCATIHFLAEAGKTYAVMLPSL